VEPQAANTNEDEGTGRHADDFFSAQRCYTVTTRDRKRELQRKPFPLLLRVGFTA